MWLYQLNVNAIAVGKVVTEIARHFEWQGLIGCGFPAALHAGQVLTAANIHHKWIGVNAAAEISKATGCPTWVTNDADAAGVAEMTFGAGAGHRRENPDRFYLGTEEKG